MAADPELTSVDPDPGPLAPQLLALVALGGALGSAARYAVADWLPTPTGFPWPTFAVNLAGALVLGVLLERLAGHPDSGRRRQLRLLIGTGLCGGLTTYSTLAVEADLLVRSHRHGLAAVYALVSILAGLVAAAAGIGLGTLRDRRGS